MNRALLYQQMYAPPNDRLRLSSDEPQVFALADRLWERAASARVRGASLPRPPGDITMVVTVTPGGSPIPHAPIAERSTVDATQIMIEVEGLIQARITFHPPYIRARVSRGALVRDPALVARLALEAPCAELLARRGYVVVHGGAVVGPRGAVVIRGPSGAGKSTLVAAAYRGGLRVLGDESVLASRADPDELAASVREITVLPDSHQLAGLPSETPPPDGTAKRRIDLFASSSPQERRAHRVTTVLLGRREQTPARLVPLSPDQFIALFPSGEIPMERWAGDPDWIAAAWGAAGGYRLDGAADLEGAVALLGTLATEPTPPFPGRG